MIIRETTPADLDDILFVERSAFKTSSEADLTRNLLIDPSAQPCLSLLAYIGDQPVGHILFSRAHIEGAPLAVSFLAPLAVVPKFQRQGVGTALSKRGLELQRNSGVEIVFVVGHPTYYPRFGFAPAGKLGFEPTYPIRKEDADAWMVQALRPGIIGSVSGRVICCDALNKPELWRE